MLFVVVELEESIFNVIFQALNKKEHKNGACSPDSPEGDSEYQLTPRTEAKYNKIDEEFQMMMQRNQLANNRVRALYFVSIIKKKIMTAFVFKKFRYITLYDF